MSRSDKFAKACVNVGNGISKVSRIAKIVKTGALIVVVALVVIAVCTFSSCVGVWVK